MENNIDLVCPKDTSGYASGHTRTATVKAVHLLHACKYYCSKLIIFKRRDGILVGLIKNDFKRRVFLQQGLNSLPFWLLCLAYVSFFSPSYYLLPSSLLHLFFISYLLTAMWILHFLLPAFGALQLRSSSLFVCYEKDVIIVTRLLFSFHVSIRIWLSQQCENCNKQSFSLDFFFFFLNALFWIFVIKWKACFSFHISTVLNKKSFQFPWTWQIKLSVVWTQFAFLLYDDNIDSSPHDIRPSTVRPE